MKKVLAVIVIIIASILFLYTVPTMQKTKALSEGKEIKVLLVYHPDYLKNSPHILAAYESVLQEEGVPY
jgi:competence protein ComGC